MQVLFTQSTDFNNKGGFKLNPLKYVQVGRDLHPACFYAIGFYVRLCVYYYLFASPACLSGAHLMRSVLPYRALISPNRLFRHHLHIVNPRRWLLSIHPFLNQSFPLLKRGHRPKTMTGTKNPLTTSQASHVFTFVDTLHRPFLRLVITKSDSIFLNVDFAFVESGILIGYFKCLFLIGKHTD